MYTSLHFRRLSFSFYNLKPSVLHRSVSLSLSDRPTDHEAACVCICVSLPPFSLVRRRTIPRAVCPSDLVCWCVGAKGRGLVALPWPAASLPLSSSVLCIAFRGDGGGRTRSGTNQFTLSSQKKRPTESFVLRFTTAWICLVSAGVGV
jgi:hypothetical protein